MPENPSNLPAAVLTATARLRRQRLCDTAGRALRWLAGTLVVLAILGGIFPALWAPALILSVLAIAGAAAWTFAAWSRPIPPSVAAAAVDERFGLTDHVLSASELAGRGDDWMNLQRAAATARLEGLDWAGRWPVRWPRGSAAFGAVAAGCVVILALRGMFLASPVTPPREAPSERAAMVEKMLEDWEKAAEEFEDPELRELVAELKPLKDALPEMSERDVLLALSTLESKLEALRAGAARESIEPAAEEMASALQDVDGLGGMAAALRRKDFAKAREEAGREAEKLAQPGAQTPAGADSAATQDRMASAAEKLEKSGRQTAAAAMSEVREGAQKNSASGMSKGLAAMAEAMQREAQRQAAQARLGQQLAQVGQCKSGQPSPGGESLQQKMAAGRQPGSGAGSESDPNRTKDPTNGDAERSPDTLVGAATNGEAQVETLQSDAPGREAARDGRPAQFAEYERLSQQAIADENLPLVYRETIRKYFETIRPAAGTAPE